MEFGQQKNSNSQKLDTGKITLTKSFQWATYGDTQSDLAEKLNASIYAVRSWEQEKSTPSHEMLISICQMYHVSSDYLLGLTDIDPAYRRNRQIVTLTAEEQKQLQRYEEFLIWQRKR